jgi:Abnormal spindle-like microcephaly-assoc'd, ASPM-SPD-2-Hydin
VRADGKAERLEPARGGRCQAAPGILAILAVVIAISVAPASAQTPLSKLCVSPDITVVLGSGMIMAERAASRIHFPPNEVQCYTLASGTMPVSISEIPMGVNVATYYPLSSTQTLLTFDNVAALPIDVDLDTVTATPGDVASYNPTTGYFSSPLYFHGASNGVPSGTGIDALGMDNSGHLLLSFDVAVSLPKQGGGKLTARPADLVSFNGTAYTMVFNSVSAGIPAGTNLDGATMLSNNDLLMTFDVIGSIAGVDFTPTDVVEFNPGANSWVMAFDGASVDDWPAGSLMQGVWAAAVPATPSSTPTASASPTATASASPTATATVTGTPTSSATATATTSATATPTTSATPTVTATGATATATATASPTATSTGSATPTVTASTTPTITATATATATITATATTTATATSTASPTATPTSVPVTLKIKPRSLKFPRTAVGTSSKPKTVKVSNPKGNKKHPGASVLIEMISDPGVFSESNNCPASLAAGASCSISVTFTPSAAAKQTGTLTITDNAHGGPQTVPLSGTGK